MQIVRKCQYFSVIILAASACAWGQSLPNLIPYLENDLTSEVTAVDVKDVDADGHDDYALILTHPTPPLAPIDRDGVIVSGATGIPIVDYTASAFPSIVVSGIYPCGDLYGDGHAEFLTLKRPNPSSSDYELRLHSGATTLPVFTINFGALTAFDIIRTTAVSDIDGDGARDIGVAFRSNEFGIGDLGIVAIYSGTTGAPLLGIGSPTLQSNGIGMIGDVDGDGVTDFFYSRTEGINLWNGPYNDGTITVLSGATYQPITTINGQVSQGLGYRAYDINDLDGDGLRDILSLNIDAGSISTLQMPTFAAYSSATGNQLWIAQTAPGTNIFDMSLAGDVNGDGIEDFLTTVQPIGAFGQFRELRSGANGALLLLYSEPLTMAGGPTGPTRADAFVGDLNADGIADQLEHNVEANGTVAVTTHTRMGSALYGQNLGATLTLRFDHYSLQPQLGTFEVSSASPSASLLIAASLAPSSTTIVGTSFPLLVSLSANHLFLFEQVMADGFGVFRAPGTLYDTFLIGTVIYLQAAETQPIPRVSNGLEILLSD